MLLLNDYMWAVANKLVKDNDFSILHIKDHQGATQESPNINLIKNIKMNYIYIRLIPIDYIWPNHLIKDIQDSKSRAKQIASQLPGRKLLHLNLYVFQNNPPEEVLQIIIKEGRAEDKKIDYFFGYADLEKEQIGIPEDTFSSLGISKEPFIYYFSHPISNDPTQMMEEVKQVEKNRSKEIESIFKYGKPLFTYIFIFINALMFLLLTFKGGSTNTEILLDFGAKEAFLIQIGEYWRLFTPIFLHIGFLHFFLNNLALYFLGQMTEKIYGSTRFLIIYLFAGIIGNIASFILMPSSIGAGASGAIYGLFGALLYFGFVYPDLFFRTVGRDILTIIGINLVFSFVVPNIDISAHIGGLLGGFMIAALVTLPKQKKLNKTVISIAVVFVLLVFSLAWWGVDMREIKGNPQIYSEGLDAYEAGNIAKAELIAKHLIDSYPSNAYYQFFYADLILRKGNSSEAIQYFERTLELNADFPYANYMIALIYNINDDPNKANLYIKEELRINPNNQDALQLLKQIEAKLKNT